MLMPKKVKYRKQQRGRMTGKAWRGSTLAFGDFGLKAMACGWITDRQIEAARVAMTRPSSAAARSGSASFPDKPITKKPAETRMGKGKGAPEAVGGGGPAGQDSVRDGRRDRNDGRSGDAPGGAQAADPCKTGSARAGRPRGS